MREGARLFSSFSFWLDKGINATSWRQLLKQLLALDWSSCEGFSMSGNTVFTSCSKDRGRLQSVGWRESSCHGYYIIHGFAAFFQLCRARLSRLHSPSTTMSSCRQPKKWEADSLGGEGGLKSLLWVPVGRGERQIVHSTSSLLKWVTVIVLVLDTKALRLVHR